MAGLLGERLRQARVMAGMSQQELANKAGHVSKQAISKYEQGKDVPSSGVLLRLCKALNARPAFLYRAAGAQIGPMAFRKSAGLTGKSLRALEAYARDAVERQVEIEQIVGGEQAGRFVEPKNVDWVVGSAEDAERVAQELRGAWELGTDPMANVTALLEEHNVRVLAIDRDGRFWGVSRWVRDSIPVIVVSRQQPGDRQRFTLAHELGHLLLRPQEGMSAERGASRFAGAFLLPARTVRQELGARRHDLSWAELYALKQKFGVSMACWLKRAEDLGIVSASRARALWRQLRARGWHLQEPGAEVPKEEPGMFEQLVRRALAEGLISESRAAELAGVSTLELWHKLGGGNLGWHESRLRHKRMD